MKKVFILIVVCLSLTIVGCDLVNDTNIHKDYTVAVNSGTVPQSDALVMFIFTDGTDTIMPVNQNAIASLQTNKSINFVVGMKKGESAIYEATNNNSASINLFLSSVEIPEIQDWIGTFGAYSTNSDGDVTFRYQGSFLNYYCTSYLPYLGQTTNPNGWDSQNITFPSPWKGKLLLVPRRYQYYHSTVYGYSISLALFLQSNI